jgi:hypothetical protein
MPGAARLLDNAGAGDEAGIGSPAGRASAVRPAVVVTRLVLWLFLLVQACDGVFTYFAVQALGIGVEGNRLLAAVMISLGPLPALVGAKALAGAAGLLLYLRGWHGTLATVTALYAIAALGPWLLVYVAWGSHEL